MQFFSFLNFQWQVFRKQQQQFAKISMENYAKEKAKLKELNQLLQNYKNISKELQLYSRNEVIRIIKLNLNLFKKRKECLKGSLNKINLLVGSTGAGKSTVFNYTNGCKLIIREGTSKSGKKNQIAQLHVDLGNMPEGFVIAPIGHGFISQTTMPNFASPLGTDTVYVDCAGQFENREVLQAIINSFYKYQLAVQAASVKLTLVINYQSLWTDRGTMFPRILKEISHFVGLWDQFASTNSVVLLITAVPRKLKDPIDHCLDLITANTQASQDLGPFKKILANIVTRKAVCIFQAPQEGQIIDGVYDQIPEGQEYFVSNNVASSKFIVETIQKTSFMPYKKGLFIHNLPTHAQFVINSIVEETIKDIKQQVLELTKSRLQQEKNSITITANKNQSQKMRIKRYIASLKDIADIDDITKVFQIDKNSLTKYFSLQEDICEFSKISNIPKISERMIEVRTDIISFLNDRILHLDEEELTRMKQQQRAIRDQMKRLQDDLQLRKTQLQIQMKKIEVAEEERIRQDQIRSQEKKYEAEIEKLRLQQDLAKHQAQIQLKKAKFQYEKVQQQLQQRQRAHEEEKQKLAQKKPQGFLQWIFK